MPPDRAGASATGPLADLRQTKRLALAGEFLRYGACSAIALAVDMAVLLAAHHLAGMHYLAAAALGFSSGLLVAYVLSVRYAFRSRRLSSRSQEFTAFAAIGVLGLVLTQILLHVLVERLHLPVAVAKAPTACVVFMFNYAVRRLSLFS